MNHPLASDISSSLEKREYGGKTMELIAIVESDANIRSLLLASIEQAKHINPDKNSNPAQTLEAYYAFIGYMEKAMPWALLPKMNYPDLYQRMDQGLCYFYFINDQPLPQLENKGYYNNSLQYVEPYAGWLVRFNEGWGGFLDSKASWNEAYYQIALEDEKFGLKMNWYEDPKKWKTFNQFFSRRLLSPDKRPIASPDDPSLLCSPADARPQGIWEIDSDSRIVQKEGVAIKSGTLVSIETLIGEESAYRKEFANGTFTHAYLDLNDYHHFHFPASGTIKEVRVIPGAQASGCYVTWDPINKRYAYDASIPGWQSLETRACVMIETENHGLVALLPIGMSHVCSINFEKHIRPGLAVNKGDIMGHFLFGGSDIAMIFQKQAGFSLDVPVEESGAVYKKVLMGEPYGRLNGYHLNRE